MSSQLSTLSGIFPRHIIEHISLCSLNASSTADSGGGGAAAAGEAPELMRQQQLQRTHTDVTIMFMDIVGECRRQSVIGSRDRQVSDRQQGQTGQ